MTWNITLWIGLGLITIGALLAFREHQWIKSAQIAPGTVTEMIASRGGKGRMSYKPRVHFVAQDGSSREFVRGYSSSPPDFVVGEHIMVAYNTSSHDFRILSFGQRFGFATILGAIGMSLLLMAVTFRVGRQMVPRIYLQQSGTPSTGSSMVKAAMSERCTSAPRGKVFR